MRRILIAATGLLVLCTACQPELIGDPAPDNTNNITTNSDTLLSQLIYLDTIPGSVADTLSLDVYRYDNQKRTQVVENYTFNGAVRKLAALATYYYNGSSTLPYKMTRIHYAWFQPDPDTIHTFFTEYTAQGKIYSDSSLSKRPGPGAPEQVTHINKYQATGPATLRVNSRYYTPSQPASTYYNDYRFTYFGNTPVQQVNNFSLSAGTTISNDSIVVSYDNRVNPVYRAENLPYPLMADNSGMNELQKNNFTSVYCRSVTPGTPNVSEYRILLNYQYNNNGLPVKATINTVLGSYLGNKIVYIYTQ
ncbi:MAG: hypothetical protein JNM68_13125 [Dinghuibacter sp.]|nr:hypothetical protein [Dinghuibacter sp.]